jgi:FKBP-type peptidyl-prolyl cis-trans isomerase
VRKLLALAATVATLAALSGCAAQNPADALMQGATATCTASTEHSNVDQIQVSTDQTKVPTVNFATPITAKTVETKVVVEGTGPKIYGDQLVDIEYLGVNGGTGKTFQSSKFDGTNFASQFLKSGQKPDFCGALAGVREGSRVAVLFPAALAHGGQGIPDLGVKATDSVVFVFDILKAFLPKALGDEKALPASFPGVNVVRAADGTPGITIPKSAAPTTLQIADLIQGRGATVKMGQTVTLHYSGFLWDGKTKFDSSWDKGQPVQFKLQQGGLIDGFLKAVVGQKIGSQVVVVIPPAQGYGSTAQSGIPANSTLVFVIDILGSN